MSKSGKFWTPFQNLPATAEWDIHQCYFKWYNWLFGTLFKCPDTDQSIVHIIDGHVNLHTDQVCSVAIFGKPKRYHAKQKICWYTTICFTYFHIKMMTTKWFKLLSLKFFPRFINVKNKTNGGISAFLTWHGGIPKLECLISRSH